MLLQLLYLFLLFHSDDDGLCTSVKMQKLFLEGKTQESMKVFKQAYPLIEALFFEVNPTCVKYALSCMGLCDENVRLPLGPVQEETKQKIKQILENTPKELLI